MTPDEMEILRLKLRIEVVRVLLRGLYTALAKSSPAAAQALRDQFADLRQRHGQITLPGHPAVYSDMVAGEYQDELNNLLSFIESGFPSLD